MKELEQFRKVRRVEAPPFLFTRIEAKIRAQEAARMPVSWQWAGAAAFALLLLLNVLALRSATAQPSASEAAALARALHLNDSNQLYDE